MGDVSERVVGWLGECGVDVVSCCYCGGVNVFFWRMEQNRQGIKMLSIVYCIYNVYLCCCGW